MGPDPIGTILGQIITFSDCARMWVGVPLRHDKSIKVRIYGKEGETAAAVACLRRKKKNPDLSIHDNCGHWPTVGSCPIAGADRIVVLKEGKVEECGTPDELTASDGFYKKMRDLQQNALGWNL